MVIAGGSSVCGQMRMKRRIFAVNDGLQRDHVVAQFRAHACHLRQVLLDQGNKQLLKAVGFVAQAEHFDLLLRQLAKQLG
jgi:hypothetical protein